MLRISLTISAFAVNSFETMKIDSTDASLWLKLPESLTNNLPNHTSHRDDASRSRYRMHSGSGYTAELIVIDLWSFLQQTMTFY
jgi:hypothetical protein